MRRWQAKKKSAASWRAHALTLRKRKDTKYQDPGRQAAVKRADRVRLVSMPSEKND